MRASCLVTVLATSLLSLGASCAWTQQLSGELAEESAILAPGATWILPPCTPPGIFADVPCLADPTKNAFTNFVEQLFSDKITAGCGTNSLGSPLFCPDSPVSRKQMAVFVEKAMRGTDTWTPAELPKGGIIMWSGTIATVPSGWALCDGRWYDPTDPSVGQPGQATSDPSHTLQTPDLTDRFILSVESSLEDPGSTGGENTLTLSVANLPAHSHSGSTGGASADHNHSGSTSTESHSHYINGGPWGPVVNAGSPGPTVAGSNVSMSSGTQAAWKTDTQGHYHSFATYGASADHTHSFTTDSVGSGTVLDNRPSFFKLAFIMKL